LLIDVAVETVLSGSSLRWVVLCVVGAFVLGSIALWRVLALDTKAELALVMFAGLVAYSGWNLGSLASSDAVRALGQSAGVLGAAVVAGVLAMGAGWVVFNPRLRPALRAALAVIFLYALIPLVASLSVNGLGAALNGSVASPPGPYWTHGAFIGIYILLPLVGGAALLLAVVSLRKSPRKAGGALRAAIAAVLALQLGTFEGGTQGMPSPIAFERLTSASPGPAADQPTTAPTTDSSAIEKPIQATASPTSESLASPSSSMSAGGGGGGPNDVGLGVRHGVEDVLAALDTASPAPGSKGVVPDAPHLRLAARSIPRELYDVNALAQALPNDPDSIDKFVRDHVGLEVYPGAMRGAASTWMGRSGNVVDRALLLAALLRAKGFQPQFATATLGDDELRLLNSQLSAVPQDYDPGDSGASPDPLELARVEQLRSRVATLVEDGARRADGIVAALAAAGTSLTNDSVPDIEELRHHPVTARRASRRHGRR
jgi:hypothetical protein